MIYYNNIYYINVYYIIIYICVYIVNKYDLFYPDVPSGHLAL
jgi:hypothetical protein